MPLNPFFPSVKTLGYYREPIAFRNHIASRSGAASSFAMGQRATDKEEMRRQR
jgi:hypothetical protein